MSLLLRGKYLDMRFNPCGLLCPSTDIEPLRYWGGLDHRKPEYPPLLRGLVNAGSNIGNIIGQLTFGFLGDTFGRKFVYGKELIVCIIGTILVISVPNSIPTPTLKMIWIFCFRVLMGVGIGGDYPMSASIVSERTQLKRRGKLLAWIFSNQGWVSQDKSELGRRTFVFRSWVSISNDEPQLTWFYPLGYTYRFHRHDHHS